MAAVLQSPTTTPAVRSGRERGFLSGAREFESTGLRVDGQLPGWLHGRLLLNGPALWELPGAALRHWFDGYAMLHALQFGDAGVRYHSRFLASEAYTRSLATGSPVFGEFGSPNPNTLLARLKGTRGTDNPAVVMSRHGERWCAVSETPHLSYFDPRTLAIEERLDLEGMHLMAAHGFTLDDGSYLNVGTRLGASAEMQLFRLPPGARVPQVIARLKMPKVGYTHAFALAPGHAVIWECALRAQPLAFRFGAKSYKDNFRWEPASGSMLHAVALDSGAVRSWRIPPMFAFHATQAWADGDGLVLELSVYEDARVFDDLMLAPRREGRPLSTPPQLVRYRLRDGADAALPEPLGVNLELQQVHPQRIGRQRARVCWGAGSSTAEAFADCTLRVDLDRGSVTRWQRPNAHHLEPLFVPRPGGQDDDDGVLLVPTLADGDEASLIGVVDARSMELRASVQAPQVLPFGFHAAFIAA